LKKSAQKQSPKEQAAAFRKAARELGGDENEERFKDALRTIAKAKPKPATDKEKQRSKP
jgi:hypothetical protein